MYYIILFLISCIITARTLEKRKMFIAVIVYSTFFVAVLTVMIFAVDVPLVQIAVSNIIGDGDYKLYHDFVIEVINLESYGISTVGIMAAVLIVQIAVALIQAAKAVACCFVRRSHNAKFRKAFALRNYRILALYLPQRINLLYCRMLN